MAPELNAARVGGIVGGTKVIIAAYSLAANPSFLLAEFMKSSLLC
jgi:hypothetical protein